MLHIDPYTYLKKKLWSQQRFSQNRSPNCTEFIFQRHQKLSLSKGNSKPFFTSSTNETFPDSDKENSSEKFIHPGLARACGPARVGGGPRSGSPSPARQTDPSPTFPRARKLKTIRPAIKVRDVINTALARVRHPPPVYVSLCGRIIGDYTCVAVSETPSFTLTVMALLLPGNDLVHTAPVVQLQLPARKAWFTYFFDKYDASLFFVG